MRRRHLMKPNILNGEFLEKNTYGESTNFNNSPEKMQEFIGKKISLKSI